MASRMALYISQPCKFYASVQALGISTDMPPDPANEGSIFRNRKAVLKHAFTGTTAEPAHGLTDTGTGHGRHATRWGDLVHNIIPLRPLHGAQALPNVPPEELFIEITVNRICRLIVILWLGFWGGWSLIPDETRVPTTKAWVLFIVIITNGCASVYPSFHDCVR